MQTDGQFLTFQDNNLFTIHPFCGNKEQINDVNDL